MSLTYTPIDEIPIIRDQLDASFRAGKLRSIEYRKEQILQIGYMIQDNVDAYKKAFKEDLGRHAVESQGFEISDAQNAVVYAYNNIDKWVQTEAPPFNILFSSMAPKIHKMPKGVVLIIGPFNYPLGCTMNYLVGSIAAGNTTVVKMPELCPAVSKLTTELLPKYVDPDVARIVNGSIPETTKLLELRWDHIVFTGSSNVGKVVANAAAKHLTPVTLELGGQCPIILDASTIDLKVAAKRIVWSKLAAAGQICISGNHIFTKHEDMDKVAAAMKEAWDSFYPEGTAVSDDLSTIVNEGHFKRVKGLLDNTKGEVVCGGKTDPSRKMVEPTVVKNVTMSDSLLSQEIFGPVLPMVGVKEFDEAIKTINSGEQPLALYVFTNDSALKKKVMENTRSGSVAFNDLMVQGIVPGLPFGGVGGSGYGLLHGKFTFDSLTHLRASVDAPNWTEWLLSWRYPPYTDSKAQQADKMLNVSLPPRPGSKGGLISSTVGWVAAGTVGAATGLLWKKQTAA